MGNTTRNLGLHVTCVLIVLSSLHCRGKQTRTPTDTLVVLSDSVTRDIDPRFSITNHDVKISRLIAPGLTSPDTKDLRPKMVLAQKIEQVGNLKWRATLRPGAHFSNGLPLTAEDVAYSYTSILDPKTGSSYRQGFVERFKKVVAVSELEVDFYLVKPVATLFSDLDLGIINKAAMTQTTKEHPRGRVIGTGPFQLSSFRPEHVVLTRNRFYAGPGPVPALTRVEVKTVRDQNARNLLLVAGAADLCQNGVRPDLVNEIQTRPRLKTLTGPSAILTYLMMHNEHPVLSDVRVRRAIALALDRKRIVDAKYQGRATLATGLLPTFHWAYNKDVACYDFDPEAAKKLLDEAGYPDPDGPGGQPRLRFSYKTGANQFRLGVARVIASQLSEVGIELDVRTFEFGTFFADIKAGNYELASMQTAAISEPDFYFTYFHSSRIPTEADPHSHNRWRYRNARIDELTHAGRETMDQDKRKLLYGEVQEILATDLPIIPLWHEDNIAVMNHVVNGYEVVATARMPAVAQSYKTP